MLRKKTTPSRLFQVCCENMSRNLPIVFGSSVAYQPTIRVSFKSVRLVAGKLGFYSRSGHTNNFKNSIRSFPFRRSADKDARRDKCMRVVCYVCPLTAFNHSWLKIAMGRNWSKQFVLAPAVSYLYPLTRIITAWQSMC